MAYMENLFTISCNGKKNAGETQRRITKEKQEVINTGTMVGCCGLGGATES